MMVYLIHLESPLGDLNNPHAQASHYIGSTCNLKKRLSKHKHNQGSHLLAAANNKGIPWKVVRIWKDQGFEFEKQLKKRKNAKRLCPICNPTLSIDK